MPLMNPDPLRSPATGGTSAPSGMDPKQIALQNKAQLEALGYAVDANGGVTMPGRGGGLFPPWVWAPDLTQDPAQKRQLSTPASDPSSPWRSSVGYDAGGPFTHRSVWDSSNGTYQGGIDWATLLGTIGAGSLIGAGAAAAVGGGGGGAAGAGTAASSEGVPFTTRGIGTVGGSAVAPAAAASSTPAWLVPALKAGAPLAITAAMRPGGSSNGAGANGLSGDQNNLLTQLIQMSLQRQQASAPVHDAAMKLALGLAPTSSWGDSPRFQQAVQQTTGPGPQASPNPQVTAAMQRLMGRG